MSSRLPTISYHALERSRSTLQDFVQSYFAYLGLGEQDFWQFMDILVYVEATIYEMDEENEALAQAGRVPVAGKLQGEEALIKVLKDKQLLEGRLLDQLQQGKLYWDMERKLCAAMKQAHEQGCAFGYSKHDVLTASAAKSFDYRVLHLLMQALCGQPYNENLFNFLQIDERLVDIGDDLVDYEDDVLNNSFNILRGFVHLYGRDAHLHLVQTISSLELEHARLLETLPKHHREHYQSRHQQASATQGIVN